MEKKNEKVAEKIGRKYSICVTHYNNVETVASSLTSILCQVDEKFEIIITDNFSTDGSREVLQRFAKENDNVTALRVAPFSKVPGGEWDL